MPISQDEFRTALSRFASGITVVTTRDAAGMLHGITVSAFCSVSLEPPLILICIEKATGCHYAFGESGVFAVNILAADQERISEHFAAQSAEKFSDIGFSTGPLGVPLIKGCLASIECSVRDICDGGDHSIFVGTVESVHCSEAGPLIYFRGKYNALVDWKPA